MGIPDPNGGTVPPERSQPTHYALGVRKPGGRLDYGLDWIRFLGLIDDLRVIRTNPKHFIRRLASMGAEDVGEAPGTTLPAPPRTCQTPSRPDLFDAYEDSE